MWKDRQAGYCFVLESLPVFLLLWSAEVQNPGDLFMDASQDRPSGCLRFKVFDGIVGGGGGVLDRHSLAPNGF